jgi:hypothetical protein
MRRFEARRLGACASNGVEESPVRRWIVLIAACCTVTAPMGAEEVESIKDAFRLGKVDLGLRWRVEQVDDSRFGKDAQASTLRTTLSAATARYRGFALDLEVESVLDIGFEDQHANGGAPGFNNGVTGRPLIVDPELTSLQRAKLSWVSDDEQWKVAIGRDEIAIGDERFLGPVGWRQHHQAFDALSIETGAIPRTKARLLWIDNVERITGAELPLSSWLVASDTSLGAGLTLSLVALELDPDRHTDAALATRTVALGLGGHHELEAFTLDWRLRLGQQDELGENPGEVDADYRDLRVAGTRGPIAVTLGWELLGAKAGKGRFQTPLATLHAFNGWADMFLATPVNGLDDRYLKVVGTHGAWAWDVRLHDFESDFGSLHYGREYDAQLSWKCPAGVTLVAKGAHFDGDDLAFDVTKLWLMASTKIAIGR